MSADNKTGSNMDLTERGLTLTTESAFTSSMCCRYSAYLRKNRIMSLVSVRRNIGALLACMSTWPVCRDSAGIVTSGPLDASTVDTEASTDALVLADDDVALSSVSS